MEREFCKPSKEPFNTGEICNYCFGQGVTYYTHYNCNSEPVLRTRTCVKCSGSGKLDDFKITLSPQELIRMKIEQLENTIKEGEFLLYQFPNDTTLKLIISRAEERKRELLKADKE